MEYIYNSDNIIDFIIKGNIFNYAWFINNIKSIIESYITKCQFMYLNKDILKDKINSIINNIKQNENIKNTDRISCVFKYINNINDVLKIKFPLGICHGDLTLSNILIDIDNLNLYLIDFLDSFIESPILDIVKIRQDTKYLWSLNMCNYNYDKNKIIILFDDIDNKLNNYFKKYNFYIKGYKYFQVLNLLRVLQYSKNEDISEKLINNILSCYSD